jgi:type VII secretion integral membrane protein EccD
VELAVPAHVPITDLMPTVLGYLDPTLATGGLAHDGWVLQRLGDPPLDEDQGTAAAGLYDGDVLHLRPRDDQLPVADFDDLVDGVHTGLSTRTDRWRPALTRQACLTVAALCGLLALLITTFGGTGATIATGAGAVGLILLGAAVALVRLDTNSRRAAVTLAGVGVVAAGVAGLAMPGGDAAPAWLGAPNVLVAGTSAAVAAVIAYLALAVAKPGFLAVACGGVLTALGGALSVFTGLGGAATASIVVTVVVVLTRAAPQFAAWLGGLAAEPVPITSEEFQQGLDPLPSKDVLDRAALADVHLTALLAMLGTLCTGALLVIVTEPRWDTVTLTCLLAVLLLMQSRELVAIWHRLATLVPATAALAVLLLGWAAGLPLLGQSGVLLGLLGLAGLAVAGAQVLPGHRLVPRWGRWGDLLHWLCALATVSIVLSVTGFYGWAGSWF